MAGTHCAMTTSTIGPHHLPPHPPGHELHWTQSHHHATAAAVAAAAAGAEGGQKWSGPQVLPGLIDLINSMSYQYLHTRSLLTLFRTSGWK